MNLGQQVFGGLKKAATWRTAVLLGASNGFLFNTISGKPGRDLNPDMSMGHGRVTQKPGFGGKHQAQMSLSRVAHYGGYNIKQMIAGVMGATAGVGSVIDTTARKHIFSLADLRGLFWTLAYEFDKDTEVWEFPSVKFLGLTLKGEIGKEVTLDLRFLANRLVNDDSGPNKISTIDTVTLPTGGTDLILTSQGQLLVNAQVGGALAVPSGGVLNDSVPFSSFELTVDRKHRIGKFTTEHGDEHAEPQHGEYTETRLKVNIDEYGAGNRGKTMLVDNLTKAAKKGTLTFTGANLAGSTTQKYQMIWWFPMLLVPEGAPEVNDPGEAKWDVTYVAGHAPGGNPTGFSYSDTTCEMFDQDAANPLA